MKQYTFKNNAGEKKIFEAGTLFEAKELAIDYFKTFLVYPCHFELNSQEPDGPTPVSEQVFELRNMQQEIFKRS